MLSACSALALQLSHFLDLSLCLYNVQKLWIMAITDSHSPKMTPLNVSLCPTNAQNANRFSSVSCKTEKSSKSAYCRGWNQRLFWHFLLYKWLKWLIDYQNCCWLIFCPLINQPIVPAQVSFYAATQEVPCWVIATLYDSCYQNLSWFGIELYGDWSAYTVGPFREVTGRVKSRLNPKPCQSPQY